MEDLLSNFEVLFKARGLSSMHGRIFGVLLLSDEPLTQDQLADKSSYSVPAVSLALDELARLKLIKKTKAFGKRKKLYTTDADLVHIFKRFLASIQEDYVIPFNRTLSIYAASSKQTAKNISKLQKSLKDLEKYLDKVVRLN